MRATLPPVISETTETSLMKRCASLRIGAALLATLMVSTVKAQAPSAAATGPSLPTNVKNAPDATAFKSQIHDFVQGQISKIISEDAAAQKAAKTTLINECNSGNSPSFFDVYSAEISSQVVSALEQTPTLRARLNLAYMVSEVARIGKSTQLEPAVIALLKDPEDKVVLWALRAAQQEMKLILANPQALAQSKLMAEIANSAKSHKSGYVTTEAYRALLTENATSAPKTVVPALPALLDVLELRESQYQAVIPDEPEADGSIATFLSRVYKDSPAPTQQRIVQLMVNFISFAGQQARNAPKADVERMIPAIKNVAQGLNVICEFDQGTSSPLQAAMSTPNGSQGPEVYNRTKNVAADLQKAKFTFLKIPPTISAGSTTTTTTP